MYPAARYQLGLALRHIVSVPAALCKCPGSLLFRMSRERLRQYCRTSRQGSFKSAWIGVQCHNPGHVPTAVHAPDVRREPVAF